MKTIKIIWLSLVFLFFSSKFVFALGAGSRIILDEDFLWLTKEGADRFVQNAKKAGFNVLVPCVWHGRGVSWHSKLLVPKEPKWAKQKHLSPRYDPLKYLIQQAKIEGMKVHPWFTFSLRQRNFLGKYYDKDSPVKSFDVHRKEFQRFMIKLIIEVVNNYDIDGINLDYMRTKGVCMCSQCGRNYLSHFKRNLSSDVGLLKVSPDARKNIIEWNSMPIEEFLYDLKKALILTNKDIVVSCDSHPGHQGFLLEGANSIGWLNKGLCDYVLSMDYGFKLKSGSFLNSVREPSKIIILVGNYEKTGPLNKTVVSRDASKVVDLMYESKKIHPSSKSTALYCYKYLDESQIKKIRTYISKSIATLDQE